MLEYSGIPGPLRLSNIGRAVNPWLRSTTEVQHLRVNKGAADLSIANSVDVGVFKFQVQVPASQRALEMWGRVQVGPIECAGSGLVAAIYKQRTKETRTGVSV